MKPIWLTILVVLTLFSFSATGTVADVTQSRQALEQAQMIQVMPGATRFAALKQSFKMAPVETPPDTGAVPGSFGDVPGDAVLIHAPQLAGAGVSVAKLNELLIRLLAQAGELDTSLNLVRVETKTVTEKHTTVTFFDGTKAASFCLVNHANGVATECDALNPSETVSGSDHVPRAMDAAWTPGASYANGGLGMRLDALHDNSRLTAPCLEIYAHTPCPPSLIAQQESNWMGLDRGFIAQAAMAHANSHFGRYTTRANAWTAHSPSNIYTASYDTGGAAAPAIGLSGALYDTVQTREIVEFNPFVTSADQLLYHTAGYISETRMDDGLTLQTDAVAKAFKLTDGPSQDTPVDPYEIRPRVKGIIKIDYADALKKRRLLDDGTIVQQQ